MFWELFMLVAIIICLRMFIKEKKDREK